MFVGSEKKLIDNLKIGGAGCISATTNFSGSLQKKFMMILKKVDRLVMKMKSLRILEVFDETGNLISALHTLKSIENKAYKNMFRPFRIVKRKKKESLLKN